MKTLKDLGDLKGKRVLVRADFNVPLDGTTITDDGRIKAALPTIKALREQGAKVILMAHLGRPKGKVVPELSLAPVAARLGELLGITVPLAADTYGEDAQAKVAAMNDGDVVLLQNVRFNPEETSKDPEERAAYAKKIAALGEVFVSDGFGVVHIMQYRESECAIGLPRTAHRWSTSVMFPPLLSPFIILATQKLIARYRSICFSSFGLFPSDFTVRRASSAFEAMSTVDAMPGKCSRPWHGRCL